MIALTVGACARVVVGAHWPSDLWVAYLMGVFWIELLMPLTSTS
jgi:membrane-associated phospholipid phosphatase